MDKLIVPDLTLKRFTSCLISETLLPTVHPISPIYSFIRMKLTSYRAFCRENRKKLAQSFGFTFRYIDDVLSLNNSKFCDYVGRIFTIELEIKDTTETERSASYLNLHKEIVSKGGLRTKLFDKRDDFDSDCKLSVHV